MTTEHLTLGPGVIGHIWRQRSTDVATYAATDRWFHYDQVGSVLSESGSAGTLAQRHEQDAFGNTVASWQSYTWGGDQPGWHHNSKEFDGDLGLVYMYLRWYDGKLGAFRSSAPFPPMVEGRYGFVESRPLRLIDPDGREIRDEEVYNAMQDYYDGKPMCREMQRLCEQLDPRGDFDGDDVPNEYDHGPRKDPPPHPLRLAFTACPGQSLRTQIGLGAVGGFMMALPLPPVQIAGVAITAGAVIWAMEDADPGAW